MSQTTALTHLAAAESRLVERCHAVADRLDEIGVEDLTLALARVQRSADACRGRVARALAGLDALAGDVLATLATAAELLDEQTSAGRHLPAPVLPAAPPIASAPVPSAPPADSIDLAVEPPAQEPTPPPVQPGEETIDLAAEPLPMPTATVPSLPAPSPTPAATPLATASGTPDPAARPTAARRRRKAS